MEIDNNDADLNSTNYETDSSPEFHALRQMIQGSLKSFHDSLLENIRDLKMAAENNGASVDPLASGPISRQASFKLATGHTAASQALNERIIAIREKVFPGDESSIAGDPLDELQRWLVQLKSQNEQLTDEKARLQTELRQSLTEHEHFVGDAKAQIQKLLDERNKFRAMVVKNAGNDGEPVEAEIEQAFREIRSKGQAIIHQYCSTTPVMKLIRSDSLVYRHGRGLSAMQKGLFEHWNRSIPDHTKQFQARAALYDILAQEIFSMEVFGLGAELDHSLSSFERAIMKHKQNRHLEVSEWRTRTINCAEWIGASPSYPRDVADLIAAFFEPILPPKPKGTSSNAVGLRGLADEAILQLCMQAYELTLKMRTSKGEYRVESIEENTMYSGEEGGDFKVQDYEGRPDGLRGSVVSHTLFGALVKYEDLSLVERTVLEPAHVICRAGKA